MNPPKPHAGQRRNWRGFEVSYLLLHQYGALQPGRAQLNPCSTATPSPLGYRYEDEINKRTVAENEFVALKKVGGNVSQKTRFKTKSW